MEANGSQERPMEANGGQWRPMEAVVLKEILVL